MSNRQLTEDWRVSYEAPRHAKHSMLYARTNFPSWQDAAEWIAAMVRIVNPTGKSGIIQDLMCAAPGSEFWSESDGHTFQIIREPFHIAQVDLWERIT